VEKVLKLVRWHGEEMLDKISWQGRNVLFLVLRGLSVYASSGQSPGGDVL
jgi:lauroyl-KDO2-lipid IV(A) myristoyltransferase